MTDRKVVGMVAGETQGDTLELNAMEIAMAQPHQYLDVNGHHSSAEEQLVVMTSSPTTHIKVL